jgi:cytochrome P450
MHHPKAFAFVTLISIFPLLILLPFINNYHNWPRSITLPFLTLFGLGYFRLLTYYTVPFFTSTIQNLPHPPNARFFFGNMFDLLSRPPGDRNMTWMRETPNDGLLQCNSVGEFSTFLLCTTPDMVKQVVNDHSYDYEKTETTRMFLRTVIGDGLVITEGNQHKLQRKAVAPAFSGKHIKDLVPVMWKTAQVLADVVAQDSNHDGVLEVSEVASHATLDIIGVACLGRDFGSLRKADDELARTYHTVLDPANPNVQLYFICCMFFSEKVIPWLPLPSMHKFIKGGEVSLRRICRKLLAEGKEAISQKDSKEVDILSVLLRSKVELNDDELTAQLLTFLAAGHETTSAQVTWTSYLLASHPEIQGQLREEINNVITSETEVTADILDSLPLLDSIIKESYRLYPAVPGTIRVSTSPTTLVTSKHELIKVPLGTQVIVPTWALQRDSKLWGEDATDFRPSRWTDGTACKDPYAVTTFLHGPRGCIGKQFAVLELKALIVALVRRFDLELTTQEKPVPAGHVTIKPKDGMYLRFKDLLKA